MKAAFIVPARNKEKYIGRTVKTILAQTYEPMELIFSDQGSTDNTLGEIEKACSSYTGRNDVRILKCPIVTKHGMSGLNAHISWLNQQTDADIIIQTSGDDLDYPTRAERTIDVYEKFNPAAVHTKQGFLDSDLNKLGVTNYRDESRFVTGEDNIRHMLGSSSSMSWSREFYERVGGLQGFIAPDVYLPYLATQDRGLYYINEELHAYVRNNSDDNTGLEGVYRAAESEAERLQIEELMHFQITNTLRELAVKCEVFFPNWNLDDRGALLEMMVSRCLSWCDCRSNLTRAGINPLAMRA